MNSKYLRNLLTKGSSSIVALTGGIILQSVVVQANADQIVASFERSLQENDLTGLASVAHPAEVDPLYVMISAELWNTPISYDNIAASFEHMLNPDDAVEWSVIAQQAEMDPLPAMFNDVLWSTPISYDIIAAGF